ncbi:hypothetical protein AAVH_24267 [Aphelenchoides avenae]|nr:hypothetical protein AAVH_24267 [Aphelenchus avenae]
MFDGQAVLCTSSTKEMEKFQPGVPNVELTLKVEKKIFRLPDVAKKGSFSSLFVNLSNDEEVRVRMIAFGRTADRFNTLFDDNSLVHFTGLDAVPIFKEENRYGQLEYELKATGASAATMIDPDDRPASGMPFSKVADIEFAKPRQRLSQCKYKARLSSDFVPHGSFGLTGQALLSDATGERLVYVQLLSVSQQQKIRFRANSNVVVKGTVKKFQALQGSFVPKNA